MKNSRLFTLLMVAALLAVVALTAREAIATTAVVTEVDSATRSYQAWAKAVESEDYAIDSATRSYIAWAKAAEAGLIPVTRSTACQNSLDTIQQDVDSATRSYIAMARYAQCQ